MKFLCLLVMMGLLIESGMADKITVFAATNPKDPAGQGIYRGALDTETGKLSVLTLVNKVPAASFLAISPDHTSLYVAQELSSSSVSAFHIGTDGLLTPLNTLECGGKGACYLSVDATGHNVLVANYGSGDIACLQRKPDGSLGARTAYFQFTGSGPYLSRQKSPHAHSIYADLSNQFVYACDLGTDSIWSFRFKPDQGTLTPNNPSSAKVPPGSGCRHLAQSPNGQFVYVNNEMGMTVSTFSRDPSTGLLSLLQTISMLPPGIPPEPNTSAEIFCHPNGHYLYVSNRTIDTLSTFRITSDGTLDSLRNTPSLAQFPRSFAIDPSGRWMIVAGQKSNNLVLFHVDPISGTLTPTDQSAQAPNPMCVLFAN